MVSLLSVGTVYCYMCVYGKRLHDTGRSAWYFLAVLAAFIMISNTLNGILISAFAPSAIAATEELWVLVQRGDGQQVMEKMAVVNKLTIIPRMITILVANGVLAYAMVRLRSDPNPNAYGPPTHSGRID